MQDFLVPVWARHDSHIPPSHDNTRGAARLPVGGRVRHVQRRREAGSGGVERFDDFDRNGGARQQLRAEPAQADRRLRAHRHRGPAARHGHRGGLCAHARSGADHRDRAGAQGGRPGDAERADRQHDERHDEPVRGGARRVDRAGQAVLSRRERGAGCGRISGAVRGDADRADGDADLHRRDGRGAPADRPAGGDVLLCGRAVELRVPVPVSGVAGRCRRADREVPRRPGLERGAECERRQAGLTNKGGAGWTGAKQAA